MRVTVAGDLVALVDHPVELRKQPRRSARQDEERRVDVAFGEEIEQPIRVAREIRWETAAQEHLFAAGNLVVVVLDVHRHERRGAEIELLLDEVGVRHARELTPGRRDVHDPPVHATASRPRSPMSSSRRRARCA